MGEIQRINQALTQFMTYEGQKYVAPAKAGDDEDYMINFKADGGRARKAFIGLAQSLERHDIPLQLVRVSNWMNQAQIARPYFYTYFRPLDQSWALPAMALRLYQEKGQIGLSWEVSVLERAKNQESYTCLHQHLRQPAQAGMAYRLFDSQGLSHQVQAQGLDRQELLDRIAKGDLSRIWLKQDIGLLTDQSSLEDWSDRAKQVFDQVYPYFLLTQE